MTVSVIIPTYNASRYLDAQLQALGNQSLRDLEILIVDSSSRDKTLEIAKSYNVSVQVILQKEFDHGGTRTFIGKISKGDLLVYMTQDALPVDESSLAELLKPFQGDPSIGLTFGRQIPHSGASPHAAHLRMFNYPAESYIRQAADRKQLGLKTVFCSNSFAAYRRSTLQHIGWFKEDLLLGEDMHVCARMLLAGYKVAYVAAAKVYHSHNYSAIDEFKRYFDTGAFHRKEHWLLEEFGRPEGDGITYVKSEVSFLVANGLIHLLPLTAIRSILKFVGYKLGYHYKELPRFLVKRLSMHTK